MIQDSSTSRMTRVFLQEIWAIFVEEGMARASLLLVPYSEKVSDMSCCQGRVSRRLLGIPVPSGPLPVAGIVLVVASVCDVTCRPRSCKRSFSVRGCRREPITVCVCQPACIASGRVHHELCTYMSSCLQIARGKILVANLPVLCSGGLEQSGLQNSKARLHCWGAEALLRLQKLKRRGKAEHLCEGRCH